MGFLKHYLLLSCLIVAITAPPVTQKKPGDHDGEKDSDVKENLEDYMEYHRYLKEVVAALESDSEFREKLEKADYVDIRTGKIAHELDFVNHNVRTKLDELKRSELERLRHLVAKEYELTNNIDTVHAKISSHAEHLDHNNPHTFEIDDLKKLIQKTTQDLEEADKKRRDEFKEYEMQKEFEKNQKIQTLDEEHRKEYEKELNEKELKHKKHQPLHHPGSRQQLEEVWEKQDHMDSQQFDPKVFFMLHDVDSNGVWDQNEVKALFLKELDKMYENGAPEDDMRERQEEMERMREHVFQESDTNRDGFISYEEFLIQTRRAEFEKDQGWKGIDEQEIFSPQEYQEFERNRLEEVQRLIQQGLIPPQPIYNPGMAPHQYPSHGGQVQHPQNGQFEHHPNAIPQQYHPNAVPQGQQYHPNAMPQQYHPNAVPQGQQYHPQGQQYNPQGQGQFQQNQGQFQQNQGQFQQYPNAAPQGQFQPHSIQQGQQQYQPNQGHQGQQQYHPNQGQQGQQIKQESATPIQQQNVPPVNQQNQNNVPPANQQYQQNQNNVPPANQQYQQNQQNIHSQNAQQQQQQQPQVNAPVVQHDQKPVQDVKQDSNNHHPNAANQGEKHDDGKNSHH